MVDRKGADRSTHRVICMLELRTKDKGTALKLKDSE